VITGDVPMGVSPDERAGLRAPGHAVQRRQPAQPDPWRTRKSFGFFQSKPASAFSPVAVTPDALPNWKGGKLHGRLEVELNGRPLGEADAGEDMTFDFGTLIAHAAGRRAALVRARSSAPAPSPTATPAAVRGRRSRGRPRLFLPGRGAHASKPSCTARRRPRSCRPADLVRIEMVDARVHSILGRSSRRSPPHERRWAGRGLQLDSYLPYRLSGRLERRLRADCAAYEDRFGLTVPQWRLVCVLAEDGGLTQVQIVVRTVNGQGDGEPARSRSGQAPAASCAPRTRPTAAARCSP
jgi:hypothetical protein